MSQLRLTVACDNYDRTLALRTGEVRADGIDINYLCLPVEETFHRMVKYREFDVAELSLSSYVLTLDTKDRPFVAIPVFPSRSFRHGGIYVNTDAGIHTAGDLVGKVVGVPEYQLTAPVWIRGILAEHYGVPVESVHYRTGGLHDPGRSEKIALSLPDSVDIAAIPTDRTLSAYVGAGRDRCSLRASHPAALDGGPSRSCPPLPTDFAAEEANYFQKTGIFPIMHVIAIRRDGVRAPTGGSRGHCTRRLKRPDVRR